MGVEISKKEYESSLKDKSVLGTDHLLSHIDILLSHSFCEYLFRIEL
ncbi:11430_t:CDS:2, partial [Dentiscutata heterogama]